MGHVPWLLHWLWSHMSGCTCPRRLMPRAQLIQTTSSWLGGRGERLCSKGKTNLRSLSPAQDCPLAQQMPDKQADRKWPLSPTARGPEAGGTGSPSTVCVSLNPWYM